jgi:NTP pyrophosphatase (non-canonical NTP hydrolase)
MTKKKTTYTERKLESVEVTKELLEKLPQLKEYKGILDKNKKKDDLADCFLQLIDYLVKKNDLNENIYTNAINIKL